MSITPESDHRKSVAEMMADWLREASVLVAVFGVLDKLVKDELTTMWGWGALALSASFFVLGAGIEAYRR